MNRLSRSVALSLLLSAVCASSAHAVAESADDVCSPVANPCIINSTIEVDAEFPLDFGLRTVRVVEPGNFVGSLELTCGQFETVGLPTWTWMHDGSATITANRSCSLNAAVPCQSDAVCADAGAGTCTGGTGGIRLQGKQAGNAVTVYLRAAGDIDFEGSLDVSSDPPAEFGGTVFMESKFGSVESSGLIDASGGLLEGYYGNGPAFGGVVSIRALLDVTLRGRITATGGGGFALVDLYAGRDTIVAASILAQGRQGNDTVGGTIDLGAGRNLSVVREAGLVRPVLDISGGSKEVEGYYGYGGGSYGGPGGYAFLSAGGDVTVGGGVELMGDSGMSVGVGLDDLPISGDWYFESGDDLEFHATLSNRGWGQYGSWNHGVTLYGESVHVGRHGTIATAGAYAADIGVSAENVLVEGRLNARSRKVKQFGYYGYTPPPRGSGGDVWFHGGDVTLKGKIMTGGPSSAGELRADVCRLHMERGSTLDSAWGAQLDGPYGVSISVGESMTMNGKIRAKTGATHTIRYRDPNKPPVLAGSIVPAATLVNDPLIGGCPVCGNLEIDEDETCDDGNTADGDGCSAACVVE
jgi:cysteine-rich repeat protein